MDPLSPALAHPTWPSSGGKPSPQEDNCLERSFSTPTSWRYRHRRLDHVARVPATGHLVASPSPPSPHHDSLATAAHHPCRARTTAPSASAFHSPYQSSTATIHCSQLTSLHPRHHLRLPPTDGDAGVHPPSMSRSSASRRRPHHL